MATATVTAQRIEGKETVADLKLSSMDTLMGTAKQVVENISETSNVFDPKIEEKLPTFHEMELVIGRVIGRGGFCVVRGIEKIRPNGQRLNRSARSLSMQPKQSFWSKLNCMKQTDGDDSPDNTYKQGSENFDMAEELKYSRDYVASMSRTKRSKGGRYVIKTVSSELPKIEFMKGHVDMALEAKFLAALDHPNIIELAAVGNSGNCKPTYFLILERMTETLTTRIKKWMDRDRMTNGVNAIFGGGKKKVNELYQERIGASYDIANGLYYLHSKNVCFRDLKPDNIGFDTSNVLKIYDFGLAKEVLECDKMDDGCYRNMTSLTGAIRYMAPEVGLGKPYNLKCDVYSWSMVMWFILALEPPFGFYTEAMMQDRVFKRGSRPAIFNRWTDLIGELLRASWDTNIAERPSFLEISLVLKQELIDCDGTTIVASSASGSVNGSQENQSL